MKEWGGGDKGSKVERTGGMRTWTVEFMKQYVPDMLTRPG